MINPKAKAEDIKQIPAPVSLFDKFELIAKIIPIHPVIKALMIADNFISYFMKNPLQYFELILFISFLLCVDTS